MVGVTYRRGYVVPAERYDHEVGLIGLSFLLKAEQALMG